MLKPEFPSLLPPGLHQFQLGDLHAAFVAPFTQSVRRSMLLAGFTKFIDEVKTLAICGELWFDGSFVTEKQDPDDIDLVLIFDPASLECLTPEQQQAARHLFHQPSSKAKYNCDVYCASSADPVIVSYWRGWYGFKRDQRTAKGVGFLTL
jgi:hypothetical protein